MKRIVISIIILLLSISIFHVSYAEESETQPNIQINFTGNTPITQEKEIETETGIETVTVTTVTFTLSLGDFTEISDNPIMGYEAILEYDNNAFSEATVEGLNGWTAQYLADTGRIIGDTTTTAEPNKSIAEITLTLKEDVEPGDYIVQLKEGLLTVNDDDSLDINFAKEVTVTIEEKIDNQVENEEQSNNETNQNQENNTSNYNDDDDNNNNNSNNNSNNNGGLTTNTGTNQNKDNTATAGTLPKTGIGTIAIIFSIITIVGIGCFIRYKSIEIK